MATRNKTMSDIAGLVGYHTVVDPTTFDLDASNGASQWRAKQGSTVLNQTDSGRRPAYSASVASIGNKPAFTFVTGTRMDFADASMFPADTAGHTILLLYRATVSKTNAIVLSWGSATGKWRIAGFGHSGQNTWAANSIGDHDSTLNVLNATVLAVHTLASGANPVSTHFVNNSAGQTKAFTGSVAQGSTAAAIGYTSFYTAFDANGTILEAVAVYNRELTASERADAQAIMAYEHGQEALIGSPARPTVTDSTGASTAPDNGSNAHTSTAPTLTGRTALQPDSAGQTHLSNSPTLTAKSGLSPDNGAQSHTSTMAALTARTAITPASSAQSHTSTQATLQVKGSLSIASGAQTHASTAPTLLVRYGVAPSSGSQTHISTRPYLFSGVRPVPPGSRTAVSYLPSRSATSTSQSRNAASPRPSRIAI